ncbi:glycosyl hydrolase family 28 protein [Sphingobacterium spiritivorum]|uniref:glycosyl hydrolase family 28 protein n=1 Tax=Sphingobacterium spiritivorum TaxID=258 RepID=UPI003DA6AF4B
MKNLKGIICCLLLTPLFLGCGKNLLNQKDIDTNLSAGLVNTTQSMANGPVDSTSFLITNFGAVGDKVTLNTAAIQRAIDSCAASGGGLVVIPAGDFLSGTIHLKTGVTLHVQSGGTLWGSPRKIDYPLNTSVYHKANNRALVYAKDANNIGISGTGTIDGQGGSPEFQNGGKEDGTRPKIIEFANCDNITVKDINLRNAAYWIQYYVYCRNVLIDHINVYSFANFNNDGIDVDSQNVTIKNCTINSQDDGICLKSESRVACRNVTVDNCTITTNCNGIKFGTASSAGFKNIKVQNCKVSKPPRHLYPRVYGQSGIAIEAVDGGIIDSVLCDNIQISGVETPIFIKLGDRSRKNPDGLGLPGKIQNVTISNVTARGESKMSSSITGFPGYYVNNIVLKNVSLTSSGGGTSTDANRVVPENQANYPENTMLGTLPAYGLYIRHAKNITLDNLTTSYASSDVRPAIYIEDAQNVDATSLEMKPPANGAPFFKFVTATGLTGDLTVPDLTTGVYEIVSALNNTSMIDLPGFGEPVRGTKVQLWGSNAQQKWKFVDAGNGYYKILPDPSTTKVLDVAGGSNVNGTQIQVWDDVNVSGQRWKISSTGSGYYTLSPNCAPSSLLEVLNSSTANGAKIQISTTTNNNNQRFKLVKY